MKERVGGGKADNSAVFPAEPVTSLLGTEEQSGNQVQGEIVWGFAWGGE